MNHDFSFETFNSLVSEGYLRKSETEDLILYGYTDKCTFDRNWNYHTKSARGLIFEKSTGKLIARPFSKFYNLSEMEETRLENLPDLPYIVCEKVDGSLGIIYFYKDKWNIATRGSLHSDQSIEGAKILAQLDGFQKHANPRYTYLVEIIYPENKIVINYGDKRELVMLAAIDTNNGIEQNIHQLADKAPNYFGMRPSKIYEYSINEMIELQKTIPKDDEGFVVRFSNGLRVKIKGQEYMRISRLMANISPLALWETMTSGKVDLKYVMQLPEEFQKEYLPIVTKLEAQYEHVKNEILKEKQLLPVQSLANKENKRDLGLFLHNPACQLVHKTVIFNLMLDNLEAVNKYIMEQIRPTNNKLKEY